MSRAYSISTRKTYGVQRTCRNWRIARSTVYHARKCSQSEATSVPRKRGPRGMCTDEKLLEHIERVLKDRPFVSEGYRKVWAVLRDEGIRIGHERILRIMRQNDLLAPHRMGKARGPKTHDGSITPQLPDKMWGTDMTTTLTEEGNAAIFIALDHCTAKCVGIHAARRGTRFEALEPIRQGVREHFGAFGPGVATGLTLRHDNGSQYISHDFQNEIRFVGIASSPSFIRQPEGNGCAERFIRTLKENLLWLQRFGTVDELRLALIEFKDTYNAQWILQRHGYRTPNQRYAKLKNLTTTAA